MPSVSLSITFVHCAQTAEDIDTIRRTFAVYLSVAQSQTFDGKLRPLKIAHCGIDQNGVYETTISLFRMVGSTIAESGRLPLRLPPRWVLQILLQCHVRALCTNGRRQSRYRHIDTISFVYDSPICPHVSHRSG